ncbi:MAG: type III pantothenate kinase [Saprospiraceae bacterium]|jgi:type III pantothenate kinase
MMMAIDIGNSNVVIGVHEGESWKYVWRYPTLPADKHAFEYYGAQLTGHLSEAGLRAGGIGQVIISSVVPPLSPIFTELCAQLFHFEPIRVGPALYPQLGLTVAQPSEIGTDLVANAVGALEIYRKDCIVVDFGTALTFTTVRHTREVLGVAIAPGLKTAINALFQKTAQLPEVPLELPATPIGKNTVHAIQSGVLWGYVGLVRHMLDAIRLEAGPDYIAVATGGLSAVLHPLHDVFTHINPHLTLDGLRIIAAQIGEEKITVPPAGNLIS